jgi:hypothetical protein
MVAPLPPLIVLATISTIMGFLDIMSTELESPKLELDLEDSEEEGGGNEEYGTRNRMSPLL